MNSETTRRAVIAGIVATPLAAGSTATAQTPVTPATLKALADYNAAHALCNSTGVGGDSLEGEEFERFEAAQGALLTSPTLTAEDIALKLEYALADELCGGQFGGSLAGLDSAMFQSMIDALRGPITRQMQGEG